jgi:hypothetical protein
MVVWNWSHDTASKKSRGGHEEVRHVEFHTHPAELEVGPGSTVTRVHTAFGTTGEGRAA